MVFGQGLSDESSGSEAYFQFPVGIRWCSDHWTVIVPHPDGVFQFPVGIRWCSDHTDGIVEVRRDWSLSIPCGN